MRDVTFVLMWVVVVLLQAAQVMYLRAVHRGFSSGPPDEEEEAPEDGPTPKLFDEALDNAARGPGFPVLVIDEELDVR